VPYSKRGVPGGTGCGAPGSRRRRVEDLRDRRYFVWARGLSRRRSDRPDGRGSSPRPISGDGHRTRPLPVREPVSGSVVVSRVTDAPAFEDFVHVCQLSFAEAGLPPTVANLAPGEPRGSFLLRRHLRRAHGRSRRRRGALHHGHRESRRRGLLGRDTARSAPPGSGRRGDARRNQRRLCARRNHRHLASESRRGAGVSANGLSGSDPLFSLSLACARVNFARVPVKFRLER